jgi:phage antirepressor YoqD-like protein
MAEAKNRAEAIAALANQNEAPKVEKPAEPKVEFNGETVDAGGDVKVGVLIASYVVKHAKEDRYVTATRGDVAKVTAAQADRAEAHSWATRL